VQDQDRILDLVYKKEKKRLKFMPKVSVLMPNYNCEKYIESAIESILGQFFTDFEFIIIDHCSADGC
jgi:cellulose synthase/poly-beta-1,6-N-acetylglucosamine synthase-like glycosyltransferase